MLYQAKLVFINGTNEAEEELMMPELPELEMGLEMFPEPEEALLMPELLEIELGLEMPPEEAEIMEFPAGSVLTILFFKKSVL